MDAFGNQPDRENYLLQGQRKSHVDGCCQVNDPEHEQATCHNRHCRSNQTPTRQPARDKFCLVQQGVEQDAAQTQDQGHAHMVDQIAPGSQDLAGGLEVGRYRRARFDELLA